MRNLMKGLLTRVFDFQHPSNLSMNELLFKKKKNMLSNVREFEGIV